MQDEAIHSFIRTPQVRYRRRRSRGKNVDHHYYYSLNNNDVMMGGSHPSILRYLLV